MKLEETENLKLQYGNWIKTNTTHINNIQGSDADLIEKIIEILNIYERNLNFKGKPSFKKWCNYCRQYEHSIAECRQKQQNNQNRNHYSRSNSNTTEFISASSSHSNPRNRHYSNNRSRNSSYNRNTNYSNNRKRSYSNNRNQNYPNNKSRNN